MRAVLSMCVMVLLLPWKLNGTLTLSPSASSKHEGTSKGLGLATRGQGSTVISKDNVPSPKWPSYITAVSLAEHKITKVENGPQEGTSESHGPSTRGSTVLSTRNQDQQTSEFRSENDTPSSKWPLYTVVSQAKHINTEVQITTENESPSHSSSQVARKGQTKRSLDYSSQSGGTSEGHGPSTGIQGSTVMSTRNREEITTGLTQEDGVISSKVVSQVTQDQSTTGMGHTEPKTTEVQITTGESESPSHLSSITSSNGQTKRSPDYSQNHQTTSTPTKQSTLRQKDRNTTGDELPTTNILKSTDKVNVTDNQQQEFSRSTKGFNQVTNHTTEVATNEPGNTSAFLQTNVQTAKSSSQSQENEGTKPTTDLQSLYTTDSNTKSASVRNPQTNDTVPTLSNSTTEGIVTVTSSMTSSGSSTGLISTENMETVTTATTGMKTENIVTSGMSTSTTTLTTFSTTQRQSTRSEISNDPNKRKEEKKKENAGPIVAALIGSALVLMFIAIFVILIRRRQTHKKKLENSDWAGPSPFLEGDAQPDKCGHGEDGLFHRRDTKRISLHSFLPQRLSQRLSLLVEEEVQMNDMAASSTFGRNEQTQNGKPSVEQVQTEKQKTDSQGPASEASADSTVPETVIGPAVLGDNANIESMFKPDDETIPPPSPKTNTAVPPPSSFEDVDLNPLQTNIVNAPPAPPLP